MSTAHDDPFSEDGKPSRRSRCSPDPTLQLDYPLVMPDGMTAAKWDSLAEATKRKLSNIFQDRKAREAAATKAAAEKKPRAKRSTSGTFTTQYAIDWAKSNGWKVIDRERYDYRTKRHHDLQLGIDLLVEDPAEDGMIGIQAAGQGERAPHYQRFLDRGGPEKAKRRSIRIVYVEFVRGNKKPILEERWA